MENLFTERLADTEVDISEMDCVDSKYLIDEVYHNNLMSTVILDCDNRKVTEVMEVVSASIRHLSSAVAEKSRFVIFSIPIKGDVTLMDAIFGHSIWSREVFVHDKNLIVRLPLADDTDKCLTGVRQKAKDILVNMKKSLEEFNLKAREFNEVTLRNYIDDRVQQERIKRNQRSERMIKLDPFA